MLALAHSAAMLGIDGYVVRVEADSAAGTPSLSIIGLPDRALGEAKDRVRAAVVNSGYRFPAGRVLVNLAPANVRKVGPAFDLSIALALQRFVALGDHKAHCVRGPAFCKLDSLDSLNSKPSYWRALRSEDASFMSVDSAEVLRAQRSYGAPPLIVRNQWSAVLSV